VLTVWSLLAGIALFEDGMVVLGIGPGQLALWAGLALAGIGLGIYSPRSPASCRHRRAPTSAAP
jgi:hypothetical protein